MRIGFIGLGHIGRAIAGRLIRSGHQLTVYNRTKSKANGLDATVADRPTQAAETAEALLTVLTGDEAVQSVLFDQGVLAVLPSGALHVSVSTIAPAFADHLAHAHGKHGHAFVSAPVLGRPEAAEQGKLFVLAAGADGAVERAAPLFDAYAQKSFVIGREPRQANLAKLATNFLLASMLESLGEALALLRKGGIEPHAYVEMLSSTHLGAPAYKTYGQMIADDSFEPAQFPVPMGLKDVELAIEAGVASGVPLPVASLLRDRFLAALAAGLENEEWAAISRLAARDAGLPASLAAKGR